VFYYTGHGAFLNNEYYYLFSDYQSPRLRQTALENTELDNLIRSLNPRLVTKIVDACQSGLPYIKDNAAIDSYLKGTQSGFRNCYFLFSSHTDEASYQDNTLSAFTRSIGERVASRLGNVRHKDIIDHVSDSFSADALQTPFFVVQADFTDLFCKVDAVLQKKVVDILGTAKLLLPSSTPTSGIGSSLKALVEKDAYYYCSREEADETLENLRLSISTHSHPAEASGLYKVDLTALDNYVTVPNLRAIGRWLSEAKHSFFAEPTTENFVVRKPVPRSIFGANFTGMVLGASSRHGPSEDQQTDYVETVEKKILGVRPTTEMPYAALLLRASPIYPNLNSTGCFVVPFVSRTHVLLFTGMVSYTARGWADETIAGEVNWRQTEARMKDGDGLSKTISLLVEGFWDFTLLPVKKQFGLVAEEPEPEKGKEPAKKKQGGRPEMRPKV
jgi:hypothetical protein